MKKIICETGEDNDVFNMAKNVLGLGPYDILPEENKELTSEQRSKFEEIIEEELDPNILRHYQPIGVDNSRKSTIVNRKS